MALLSTALMSSDDWLQQVITHGANFAEIEWNFILAITVFNLCLWTLSWRLVSNAVLALFMFFSFVQIGNIAYFGQPLNPADIPNLFNDLGEVWQTGTANIAHLWQVPLCTLLPYGALFYLHNRFRFAASSRWRAVCLVLIIVILASKPYRASYRSMAFFMPGPTRASLHNSLNAWSYFAMHVYDIDRVIDAGRVPTETFSYQNTSTQHVWVVVADSLRTDRLSAYGYSRDTTPFLRQRAERGELLTKPGIAAGVSTIVSLSHMVNQVYQPARQKLLSNHHNNIYHHAKKQGFQTLWLSSQESKLLSFLGADDIDVRFTNEDAPLLFAQKGDLGILDVIQQQDWSKPSFAIINLRTVHSPYSSNYEGLLDNPPWPTSSDLDHNTRENNAYDNALYLLDATVEAIIQAFEALPGEGYLVFTGDHGQFLGEDNRWGHNKLEPEIIHVPVMAMTKQTSSDALEALQNDTWISHLEAMHWLSNKMGINISGQQTREGFHYVKGSKLLGDNFIMTVQESPNGLIFGKQQLISEWLNRPNE